VDEGDASPPAKRGGRVMAGVLRRIQNRESLEKEKVERFFRKTVRLVCDILDSYRPRASRSESLEDVPDGMFVARIRFMAVSMS
jgi:hypothetical protein